MPPCASSAVKKPLHNRVDLCDYSLNLCSTGVLRYLINIMYDIFVCTRWLSDHRISWQPTKYKRSFLKNSTRLSFLEDFCSLLHSSDFQRVFKTFILLVKLKTVAFYCDAQLSNFPIGQIEV